MYMYAHTCVDMYVKTGCQPWLFSSGAIIWGFYKVYCILYVYVCASVYVCVHMSAVALKDRREHQIP